MTDILAIMARYPESGAVKTRLARVVGDDEACRLYRAFLTDLDRRLGNTASVLASRQPRSRATGMVSATDGAIDWSTTWAMTPAGGRLDGIVGGSPSHIDQRGASLGERMHNVFADLFERGATRVAMLGADIPHMSSATIQSALAALSEHDVVLVPSRDGGYCLVAMHEGHDIFSSVPMGNSRVLDETTRLCRSLDLSCELLEPSFDVDEIEDVVRLDALLRGRDGLAATDLADTHAVLEDWRRSGWLARRPE